MPGQNDFLVHLPDKPGVLKRRMEHIGAHLTHNKPLLETGSLILSGPTLTGHPEDPKQGLPITGSVLIFRTGTAEEVWQMLAADPLAKEDVWDMEKATVTPYRCGLWKPY